MMLKRSIYTHEKQNKRTKRFSSIGESVSKCIAIEDKDTKDINAMWSMVLAIAIIMLPYRKPHGHIYQCKKNNYVLTIMADHKFGLPYGSPLRLIFALMIDEIKQTKSPVLCLDKIYLRLLNFFSSTSYADEPNIENYLYDQMLRLFSSQIFFINLDKNEEHKFDFWQSRLKGRKKNIFSNSSVSVTKDFFNELMNHPNTVDFKILKAIRYSTIQIDIYIWLVYQFSYLKELTFISWNTVNDLFGSNYDDLQDIKNEFMKALHTIIDLYYEVNVDLEDGGFVLKPNASKNNKNKATEGLI